MKFLLANLSTILKCKAKSEVLNYTKTYKR